MRPKSLLLACLAACTLGPKAILGIKAMTQPAPDAATVAANPDVQAVAAANTDFGFRMLRYLVQDQPQGNVFFSPLSVSSALAMTLNGAGDGTERDMAKALGLGARWQR